MEGLARVMGLVPEPGLGPRAALSQAQVWSRPALGPAALGLGLGSGLIYFHMAAFKTCGFLNMWMANAFQRMGGQCF